MSLATRRLLWFAGITVVLAGLLLAGLAMIGIPASFRSTGYSFTSAEIDLPKCVDRSPIIVSELADQPRSTCDPTGVELVLPDGHRMMVQPPLSAYAESSGSNGDLGPTYSTVNFGIYGVCVAERSGDNRTSRWWGTAEAIRFCQEYGTDAPTNWG